MSRLVGLGRRHWIAGIAVVALGLVGFELWPRDATRITGLLNGLCAQLNETRDGASLAQLRQALSTALLPNASLRVIELDLDAEGSDEIARRANELLTSGVPVSFALSSMDVHVSGALARVDLDLLVMPRGSGEQRRDLRHTRVRLSKADGAWRIEAVEIAGVADSQPEARP